MRPSSTQWPSGHVLGVGTVPVRGSGNASPAGAARDSVQGSAAEPALMLV